MTEMFYSYHFLVFQTGIVALLMSGVLLLNIAVGLNFSSIFNIQQLLIVVLSAAFIFLGSVTVFRGFEVGNVSVGGVILSSRVFISIPVAILFFGEIYPVLVYIMIIIILVGNLFVSWTEGLALKELLSFKGSGGRWFILTAIFFAVGNILVREINNAIPLAILLAIRFYIYFVLAIMLYPIFNPLLAENKRPKITKTALIGTSVFALLTIIAEFAFLYVLGESLTIAEGLGVFEGIFTFSISIFVAVSTKFNHVLKEPIDRKTLFIRTTGALIAILGTVSIFLINNT